MHKEIENLEFVPGVNFEFIDWLRNNVTRYWLFFDDSREETRTSKAFVDVATAGRHYGTSTFYLKHNLFHQSKPGRDLELQNTRIFLFKSPGDVIQVSTLSAQLRLRSELVDWYRDTTFLPYADFSIYLSLRANDGLRYCTNT